MREIKFRAWHKKEKKMYRVFGLFLEKKEISIPDWDLITFPSFKEVELMQFIGLHDKNGKEIYSGDIVKGYFEKKDGRKLRMIGEVCWDFIGFSFKVVQGDKKRKGMINYFNFIESDYTKKANDLDSPFFEDYKVIGNKFENPELLKND